MVLFTQLSVALALISLASSSPVSISGLLRTFTVSQNTTKPIIKSGPLALANAYQKFKVDVPADVAAAAAAAADGSVTATPEANDAEYLCPVTIGGQTLNLDFDTGSADLYVVIRCPP